MNFTPSGSQTPAFGGNQSVNNNNFMNQSQSGQFQPSHSSVQMPQQNNNNFGHSTSFSHNNQNQQDQMGMNALNNNNNNMSGVFNNNNQNQNQSQQRFPGEAAAYPTQQQQQHQFQQYGNQQQQMGMYPGQQPPGPCDQCCGQCCGPTPPGQQGACGQCCGPQSGPNQGMCAMCCPANPGEHCCETDPYKPSAGQCLFQMCDATTAAVFFFTFMALIGFAVSVGTKNTDNLMRIYDGVENSAQLDIAMFNQTTLVNSYVGYVASEARCNQLCGLRNGTSNLWVWPPINESEPTTTMAATTSTSLAPGETTEPPIPGIRPSSGQCNFARDPSGKKKSLTGNYGGELCDDHALSATGMLLNLSRWNNFRGTLFFIAFMGSLFLSILIVVVNKHQQNPVPMAIGGDQQQMPPQQQSQGMINEPYKFYQTTFYQMFRFAWAVCSIVIFFWVCTEMYQYWWFDKLYKNNTSGDLNKFWKNYNKKFVGCVVCVTIFLCWPLFQLVLSIAFSIAFFLPWMAVRMCFYPQVAHYQKDPSMKEDDESCCLYTDNFFVHFRNCGRLGFSEGIWNLLTGTTTPFFTCMSFNSCCQPQQPYNNNMMMNNQQQQYPNQMMNQNRQQQGAPNTYPQQQGQQFQGQQQTSATMFPPSKNNNNQNNDQSQQPSPSRSNMSVSRPAGHSQTSSLINPPLGSNSASNNMDSAILAMNRSASRGGGGGADGGSSFHGGMSTMASVDGMSTVSGTTGGKSKDKKEKKEKKEKKDKKEKSSSNFAAASGTFGGSVSAVTGGGDEKEKKDKKDKRDKREKSSKREKSASRSNFDN